MKIRNSIADIRILQTHILQDYFRMALAANFIDDRWKFILSDAVHSKPNEKYLVKKNFVAAWDKMRIIGRENYSIEDMDTTFIIAIFKDFDNPFSCCSFKNIKESLDYLQTDRNIDAHTTGNETDSELFQWACGSLHNIERFISTVAKATECKAPDDERKSYARKYQAEIAALRLQFDNDNKEACRAEEIEQSIIRNVERIKTSNDSHSTYMEIERQYFNKRDNEGKVDFILYKRFMQTAADAGILWACSLLGDLYFNGSMTGVDYIKAAEYYEKGFSQLIPPQKLNLASIYLNDICSSSHTKEEGMTILKSCESPRHEIIPYISKDGYKFYSLK